MTDEKIQYPAVTVDVVLVAFDGKDIKTLLIQRKNPPFKNEWAFPGGFIEPDETLEESAVRELREETSVELYPDELIQFYSAGNPGRDPRGRTISVCFLAFVWFGDIEAEAADDAQNLDWFNVYEPPQLAFDHKFVLEEAVVKMYEMMVMRPQVMLYRLLPEEFLAEQFKKLLEAIFGNPIDINNFLNIYQETGYLEKGNIDCSGEQLYYFIMDPIPEE